MYIFLNLCNCFIWLIVFKPHSSTWMTLNSANVTATMRKWHCVVPTAVCWCRLFVSILLDINVQTSIDWRLYMVVCLSVCLSVGEVSARRVSDCCSLCCCCCSHAHSCRNDQSSSDADSQTRWCTDFTADRPPTRPRHISTSLSP